MTAARQNQSTDGVTLNAAALIFLRGELVVPKNTSAALSSFPGGFALKRRGNGQDVADTRAYVDGDDMRYLDRGATARTGTLHIRTFQEERDKILLLVADFRPSMLWGTKRAFRSVAAAEALALCGWRAVEEGGRVGLYAITASGPIVVQARGRTRGMLDVINGMVNAHETALSATSVDLVDPDLSKSLSSIKRVAPIGAEILIASGMDSLGPQFDFEMGDLARRRHPTIIKVTDRAIEHLPPGHYPIQTLDGKTIKAKINKKAEMPPPPTDLVDIPTLHLDAGKRPAVQLRQLGY